MARENVALKFFNPNDESALMDKFPAKVCEIVREIWDKGRLGLSPEHVQIGYYYNMQYKISAEEVGVWEVQHTNHYLLGIPYAGRTIKWDLILKKNFNYLPDFLFDDDFLNNPPINLISKYIPSMSMWTERRPVLTKVLKELMVLYKDFNVTKLKSGIGKHCFFIRNEYNNLLLTARKRTEVLVRNDCVYILVFLTLRDTSGLPPYVRKEESQEKHQFGIFKNPNKDTATLQFSVNPKTTERVLETALSLSPRLEQVLTHSMEIQLPKFTIGGTMVSYVTAVETLLEDNIRVLSSNYAQRCTFVSTILSLSAFSIIEYDTDLYSKITLLYDYGGTCVLLQINIPEEFPIEKPQVTLTCVYYKNKKISCDNYPYDSTWTAQLMFAKILEEVAKHVSKLKI